MNQTAEVAKDVVQNTAIPVQQDGTTMTLIYCVLLIGILYFFILRPNKKRMAEYQKMLDSIKVGNRVMAAGIYGTVKKINEKTLDVEIAKGVVIEVHKNAVACVE